MNPVAEAAEENKNCQNCSFLPGQMIKYFKLSNGKKTPHQ